MAVEMQARGLYTLLKSEWKVSRQLAWRCGSRGQRDQIRCALLFVCWPDLWFHLLLRSLVKRAGQTQVMLINLRTGVEEEAPLGFHEKVAAAM